MDLRRWWDRWFWLPVALGLAIVFARVFFGREPFCASAESEHCLREWLSALGGWAAVTTALLTIVPIFLQLQEMKRQTAFIVGDELPSIEILANSNHAVYRFRIVNWNRRAFLLEHIHWLNGTEIKVEDKLRTDIVTDAEEQVGRVYTIQPDGQVVGWIPMEGWENRNRRPAALYFWRYALEDPTLITFDPEKDPPVMLEVTGTLAGDVPRKIVLRAEAQTLLNNTPVQGGPGPIQAAADGARALNLGNPT